ncbi:penicillin acylase family protein [Sphingomonas quercus]|uniref:Penicillin acylase family protein n=1 Tax=Sphingomonas quercus TaxID=2842451 RepID=A0ABS6BKT7_9SPHN|nr:penicillin acylase family protein [Sphingomonas quercus]MBU3078914.1 penicillin acylase family protein [Sphingomonas quercus]
MTYAARAVILAALALAGSPVEAAEGMAAWKAQASRVTITRDDWGIAHVKGRTDADAVFGMIYAQAEDDFNRIETNYLVNLGRLAEAEGEKAVWQDLRQRLYIDPVALKADYARSPAWLKTLMQAWADGLNFYLATHPGKARVLTRFEPWMALSFSEGSIGGDIERIPLSQLEAFYGKRKLAMTDVELGRVFREPQGSNGIAIAPGNTQGGHALLLINPHTSFFFRSELQMTSDTGLNAYGAATWGQFFIYQGFNAHAGWMHTSAGVDNVDEFAETIVHRGDKLFYRYGTGERPVTTATVTLKVKDAGTRRFTVYRTHHGPIVREADGKWIAFAMMYRPVAALEQSFLRTKATNYAAFSKVAELKANSSNNTLYADDRGTIAFLTPQFMPVRDNRFDYTRPVDGSDPATDWKGLHRLDELPRLVNPANGWVFNTNDWPWSAAGKDSIKAAAFPRYLDQVGENPRAEHAIRVLDGIKDFTLPSLITGAYDSWLPAFTRMMPALLRAYEGLPAGDSRRAELAAPIALLRGWDQRWAGDSTATTLAVFWGENMWREATERLPAHKGMSRYDIMADAMPDDSTLAALSQAVARLKQDFGEWRVPWGEVNRYQRNDAAIVQQFDDAKPSVPVPFASAQWGSLASFGARRYPGTKRFYGTSGNSFVAAVEFGPKVTARAVSVGGESGDPASPHFSDQIQRYASGDLRPVYFYPDDLASHARRRYRPGE